MENEFDKVLKHALSPKDEPDFWLNQKILSRVEEQNIMVKRKRLEVSIATMVAAFVLGLSSVTVYAAWKYLSAADVAQNVEDTKLAKAFVSEQAFLINETQCYGDYRATLLSIVSGEMLSTYSQGDVGGNNNIPEDRTYAVVAIERADGTPMPDTAEESYGELELFASVLIGGYNPAAYNIAAMSGNYADVTEDGILYRLFECDTVEIFADHALYICVSEGTFYNTEAYDYDEMTGQICRNEAYEGLNALFHLPIDPSKAKPQKAAEYIASQGFEPDISEEKLKVELEEGFEVEVTEGNKEGAEIAEYALRFVGNPYVWGADSLTEGTDSSGFTKSVYEHFGVSLAHDSRKQKELGTEVGALENARPGDLVFYDTPSHVAIYIGDGLVVHSVPLDGICISQADFDEIESIRRISGMK